MLVSELMGGPERAHKSTLVEVTMGKWKCRDEEKCEGEGPKEVEEEPS